MRIPSVVKRLATVLGLATVLVTAGVMSAAPAMAAPPRDSDFNFGSEVGHFTGHLHFINSGSFTLSNVKVKDTLCDNRAALADVRDQTGELGQLHTYTNGSGCNTTTTFSPRTFSPAGGVSFVQIRLRACSAGGGCSDSVWSAKHFNPD